MIDADLIGEGVSVKEALATLAMSNIIQQQIQREIDRIVNGNADQPIEEAARDLLDHRRKIQSLRTFLEICEAADKEIHDA